MLIQDFVKLTTTFESSLWDSFLYSISIQGSLFPFVLLSSCTYLVLAYFVVSKLHRIHYLNEDIQMTIATMPLETLSFQHFVMPSSVW